MKLAVFILIAILLIIHQDFWYWNDDTLVMGVMPIGLFYHMCISLAATFVWFLSTIFAWPEELDDIQEEVPGTK